jgi:trk system potassium uptake protein
MKSFIVLGLGHFGRTVSSALYEMGQEVLAVDSDENIVKEMSGHATHTMQADMCAEDLLSNLDIQHFDSVIVAVGNNMPVSIMVTVLLKELGAKHIVAKAQDDLHEKILYKLGVDKVVLPERDIGVKIAQYLTLDNIIDLIEVSPDYGIINMHPPEAWQGKSLEELAMRTRYNVNVIAVKESSSSNMLPSGSTILHKNSQITIIGAPPDLRKITNLK